MKGKYKIRIEIIVLSGLFEAHNSKFGMFSVEGRARPFGLNCLKLTEIFILVKLILIRLNNAVKIYM